MPAPSVTYTFTNSTTADATEVNQNFTDLVNSLTDGLKDLTINAITCNGAATFNGAVTLGNATADDITFTGSLASSIPIKTNNTYDIGTSTLGLRKLYLGNGGAGATCDIISASHATTREYSVPDCGAAANFVMTQLAQTISGVKTFDGQVIAKGTATNDSASAGYIGEIITTTLSSNFTQNSATAATYYDVTSGTLALTAGDWDVMVTGFLYAVTASGGTTLAVPVLSLRNAAGTVVVESAGASVGGDAANAYVPRETGSNITLLARVLLSGNDTHKLSVKWIDFSGTPTVNLILYSAQVNTLLIARRRR